MNALLNACSSQSVLLHQQIRIAMFRKFIFKADDQHRLDHAQVLQSFKHGSASTALASSVFQGHQVFMRLRNFFEQFNVDGFGPARMLITVASICSATFIAS